MEEKKLNHQPLENEATPELNEEALNEVTGGFELPVVERDSGSRCPVRPRVVIPRTESPAGGK